MIRSRECKVCARVCVFRERERERERERGREGDVTKYLRLIFHSDSIAEEIFPPTFTKLSFF